MPDQRYTQLIELLLKGDGAKEAIALLRQLEKESDQTKAKLAQLEDSAQKTSRGLSGTGRAAKESSGAFSSLRGILGSVAGAFGFALSAAAAVREVLSDIVAFAKYERSLGAIAFQLRQFGLGGKAAAADVRSFLEGIEAAGGPLRQELVPIFSKLLGITKEVSRAMDLTKLAVDASETGFISAGAAADGLANILQGRALGAAQAFGIEAKKADGTLKSQAELLDEVRKKFGGYADSTSDTREKLDSLEGGLNDVRLAIGEVGSAAVLGGRGLRQLGDVIRTVGVYFSMRTAQVREFAAAVLTVIPQVIAALKSINLKTLIFAPERVAAEMATGLAAVGKSAKEVAVLHLTETGEAFRKLGETVRESAHNAVAIETEAGKKIEAIWSKTGTDSSQALAEGRRKNDEATGRQAAIDAEKAAHVAEAARLAAQLQGIEAGTPARLAAELKLLDAQQRAELDKIAETNRTAADIQAEFDQKKAAASAAFSRTVADANKALVQQALQAELAAAAEGSAARERIEEELFKIRRANAIEAARDRGLDEEAVARAFDAQHAADGRKRLEERQQFELSSEKDLLQEKIAISAKGSAERYQFELRLLQMEEDAAIEAATKKGAATLAIEEEYGLKKLQLLQTFTRESTERALRSMADLMDAEAGLLEEGSAERLEIEEQILNFQRELELASFEGTEEEKNRLRQKWDALALKQDRDIAAKRNEVVLTGLQRQLDATVENTRENYQAKLALLRAALQKELAAVRGNEVAKAQIRKKYANAETDLTVRTVATQISVYANAASILNNALIGAFGQRKAFAYAAAVISVAQAVADALGSGIPYPGNVVLAAAVGVLGAVQIAKISSTTLTGGGGGSPATGSGGVSVGSGGGSHAQLPGQDSGQGFDNPKHDKMAFNAGYRWAEDITRNVTLGWGKGLNDNLMTDYLTRQGPVTTNSTTNNTTSGDTLNIAAKGLGTRAEARRFIRELRKQERRDEARKMK